MVFVCRERTLACVIQVASTRINIINVLVFSSNRSKFEPSVSQSFEAPLDSLKRSHCGGLNSRLRYFSKTPFLQHTKSTVAFCGEKWTPTDGKMTSLQSLLIRLLRVAPGVWLSKWKETGNNSSRTCPFVLRVANSIESHHVLP